MKKLIILQLEVDADGAMLDDDFIIKDLKTEIKCASNDYEIISIYIQNSR